MKRVRQVKTQKQQRLLKNARGQEAFKASSALSVWSGGARSVNNLKISSFMSLFASVSLVRQKAFVNRKDGRGTGRPKYGKIIREHGLDFQV